MISHFKASEKDEDETVSIKNGRLLLQESVLLFGGSGNPIHKFSAKEVNMATQNFDLARIVREDGPFIMYRGVFQGRLILVQKHREDSMFPFSFKEIAIAARMSDHKNALKLLGCCLETEVPILVYEFAKDGTLEDRIFNIRRAHSQPLLWRHRLKIAVEVASAVAYLHTAFPRPIVHKELKPANIFLDEDCVAKLSGFYFSKSIPEDESYIQDDIIMGACGYAAPEYMTRAMFNEKSDVYNFGLVLLVLFTGKRAGDLLRLGDSLKSTIARKGIKEIVDCKITEEGSWPDKEQQLQAFATLALSCISENNNNRPTITEAGKQLREMYLSLISTHQNASTMISSAPRLFHRHVCSCFQYRKNTDY